MEDLLIVLFQIIGQIIFELLAYSPFDYWWPSRTTAPQEEEPSSLFWWWFLIVLAGALTGWCSLYLFPDVMVKFGWLRIALLVISPLGSAFLAKSVAEVGLKKNGEGDSMSHFWFALCFSAGLVAVRFAFAHRPT